MNRESLETLGMPLVVRDFWDDARCSVIPYRRGASALEKLSLVGRFWVSNNTLDGIPGVCPVKFCLRMIKYDYFRQAMLPC
jgi:hypothetical protein